MIFTRKINYIAKLEDVKFYRLANQRTYTEISNCSESGRVGSFLGELTAMRFSRPDSPEISLQADLLTANSSAINAIRC